MSKHIMEKITDATISINSSARWTFRGNDLATGTFEWLEGTTPISKEDIQTEMDKL